MQNTYHKINRRIIYICIIVIVFNFVFYIFLSVIEFKDELFETISVYFPIDFSPVRFISVPYIILIIN